jgi:hypothetical protein
MPPIRFLPIFLALLSVLVALGQEPPATPASTASATAVAAAVPPTWDPKEIIRRAADNDLVNDQKQRDYTYLQRTEQHKLNGKGEVQSSETRTHEVMVLYGEQVERLIAKNDKPLAEKDATKEEDKIQKLIEKRKKESEEDRRKRLEKYEKEREDGRAFVKEVTAAYSFTLLPEEAVGGREAFVIAGEPKPGYQAPFKEAKILPKFRFKVWVDTSEYQWVKLEAEVIDTVSLGWFLARIHRGSRLAIETTRINDEVWLPKHVALKLDAKLALLKNLDYDVDVTYRDYRKFRTDTKVLSVGEVEQ